MLRLFVIACAVAALSGCGAEATPDTESEEASIVGGKLARSCEWAATVALGGCSGALVHPQVVTTAAHCLVGSAPNEVLFGDGKKSPKGRVPIAFCEPHPSYRDSLGYDIGFCVLSEPVTDIPFVPPLAACEAHDALHAARSATLVGFGRVSQSDTGQGFKRWVEAPIDGFGASDREVIVGTRARGACGGDSGGPAFVELPDGTWRTFGVASRRGPSPDEEPAETCASTTVYTSIAAHLPWLEARSSFDLTPCHDAQGWQPNDTCRDFPTAPGTVASWKNACAAQAGRSPAQTCARTPLSPIPKTDSSALHGNVSCTVNGATPRGRASTLTGSLLIILCAGLLRRRVKQS